MDINVSIRIKYLLSDINLNGNNILSLKCFFLWLVKINDYLVNNILVMKVAELLYLLAIFNADSITAEAGPEKVDKGEYDFSKSV